MRSYHGAMARSILRPATLSSYTNTRSGYKQISTTCIATACDSLLQHKLVLGYFAAPYTRITTAFSKLEHNSPVIPEQP